jgi:hypothetical protein
MSQESSDALHLGVGVAATCIGVLCSLYTCCCHVWRRLKGHTPVVAAGAAVAAGTVAAGQLASVLAGTSQSQGPLVSGLMRLVVATSRTAVLVRTPGVLAGHMW